MTSGEGAPPVAVAARPAGLGSRRLALFWSAVLLLVAADLLSKDWAWSTAPPGQGKVPLLGDWLYLHCVYNPGGLFGLGQELTLPLTLVRALAAVFLAWLMTRQAPGARLALPTLALLEAGALGNLYDNLSRWAPWAGNGEVRDFLRVELARPGFWPERLWPFDPWPIFNLADACITVGFLLLITGAARVRLHRPQAPQGEGR